MSYNLFLDDIRQPYVVGNYIYPVELRSQYRLEDWVIVRNHKEFIKYIQENGLPFKVSFDHDLADIYYDGAGKESFSYHENTGYDCAKWLKQYCLDNEKELPLIFVHSANPVGAENIRQVFTKRNPH